MLRNLMNILHSNVGMQVAKDAAKIRAIFSTINVFKYDSLRITEFSKQKNPLRYARLIKNEIDIQPLKLAKVEFQKIDIFNTGFKWVNFLPRFNILTLHSVFHFSYHYNLLDALRYEEHEVALITLELDDIEGIKLPISCSFYNDNDMANEVFVQHLAPQMKPRALASSAFAKELYADWSHEHKFLTSLLNVMLVNYMHNVFIFELANKKQSWALDGAVSNVVLCSYEFNQIQNTLEINISNLMLGCSIAGYCPISIELQGSIRIGADQCIQSDLVYQHPLSKKSLPFDLTTNDNKFFCAALNIKQESIEGIVICKLREMLSKVLPEILFSALHCLKELPPKEACITQPTLHSSSSLFKEKKHPASSQVAQDILVTGSVIEPD